MSMEGKAAGFALQVFEAIEEQGWSKWQNTPMEGGTIVGLKNLVDEHFSYFKCPELALAKLESYHQKEEEIEEYLTNFQNLRSEAKIDECFTKRLLLKNIRRDIVEVSVIQSRDLEYAELINDLQRIGKASRVCLLMGGEQKETPPELRGAQSDSCSVFGEPEQV